tara:strand:- start:2922 stop:3563 length:642 start_codon:yes stop_codon:yes gene_type:complete
MNTKDNKYVFKIVIIGESGSGKSSLLLRYTRDIFNNYYEPTIGVDFATKQLDIPSNGEHIPIKLQIWDTAGQERFSAITKSYYRNTCGVIVVFDLTSLESFYSIPKWITNIKNNCDSTVQIILIGNKADLTNDIVVKKHQIDKMCKTYGIRYFETSAMRLDSTSIAFNILSQNILESINSMNIPSGVKIIYQNDAQASVNLSKKTKKKKCCIK